MAIALGGNSISKAYLGSTEIQKMYLGSELVFDNTVVPVDLKPIMNNFRVNDATPTHVHFDTPLGPISSLSTTDFTISGRTILAVDTTLNYFTVDTAFNYWDNNTIRKTGGNNDIVYDFTMERIDNNIPVPTIAPANYRYVAEDGSDSANGLTEGTAWLTLSHAIETVPSGGYKIWVKVGTYLGDNITDTHLNKGASNPAATTPLIIEGYISTIGDITSNYYTLTPNTAYPALDSTEMPLFDGGDSSVGRFVYNDDTPYTIWKNLQVTGYAEAFRSRFSNVQGQQVINSNVKDMGVIGSNYGYGVYWVNETVTANRNRILGSNFINCESNATQIDGEHSLTKGCKVYSNVGTTGSQGTDYYYATSGSNNIYLDNLAYNDGNGGHNGHGFSAKTGGDGLAVHYNLYDNCEAVAIQGAFQARHANCKFNVWKNSIARADIPNRKEGSSDNYTGCIDFQSGGDQNVFENLTCHDTHQFIRFNLNGESDTDPDIQTNALIKNCLVYDVKNVIDANSVIAGVSAPSGNKLANCTIKGADNMFWQWAGTGSVEFGLNKIENCIIEGVEVLNKDEVVVGWTYSYNDFWNSFTTPSGTGNFEVDPELDASYQPQATFTDIDVPKINNVFYGKNGVERQDPTTVGSVLSASEIPSEPPVTDFDFYVSATGTGDGLTSDTPMSFADSQTTINSMTNGQSIGYKGGDEFFGSLSVTGRTGITIGSYGTGKAIIRGSKDITTSFADTGSNMWTASTGSDTAYQVFKDGELLTMGRLPKIPASNRPDLGYYDVTSKPSSSYTTIASSTGTGLPASGATAHISSESWVLEARTVQNYNSGTGGFTWSGNTQYDIELNSKYFLNNRLAFCTTQDEWYYSSGTLYIYSVDQPTGISINTISGNAFNLGASNNITIKDLVVRDFYNNGFEVNNSDSVSVENCDIKNVYFKASNLISSQSFSITNCTIDRSNYSVMTPDASSHDAVMSNNTITNLGVFENISSKNMGTSMVTESYGDRTVAEYNHLTNLGYNGILMRGVASIVRYNFTQDVSMMMDDGAAYYLHSSNYNDDGNLGTIVSYNIVVGHPFAVTWYSNGLYTDDRSRGATLEHNTCIGTLYGLYMHNCLENAYRYNNFYGTLRQCVYMQDDSIGDDPSNDQLMQNNIVQYNNMFVTSDNEKYAPIVWRTQWEFYDFGDVDFNRYFNPYYPTSIGFGTATINEGQVYNWNKYPLATWQSGYGGAINADANSVEDALNWTYPEADTKSQCVYNATNSPVITPLVGTWYGMDGTEYVDEITLEPFTSEILINELAVPPTPSGELYPINDAASIDNEANLVASEWSYEIDVSIKSVTTSPQLGSYCLELEQTLGGSGKFRGLQMTVENGSTYNYSFWGKSNSGNARSRAWFGVVASPDHTMTSSWVQYSGSVTANSTTMTLNFQPNASAGSLAGDTMYVDTFTITKV